MSAPRSTSFTMSVSQAVGFIFFLFYNLSPVLSASSYDKLLVVAEDIRHPTVLKFRDSYYMVGSYSAQLLSSKDLKTWKKEKDSIFDDDGYPNWAQANGIISTKMHAMGKKFNLYFYALKKEGKWSIGAATADSPLGPFKDIGRPLLTSGTGEAFQPHVAQQGTYLRPHYKNIT